jgi:hypothetical protein
LIKKVMDKDKDWSMYHRIDKDESWIFFILPQRMNQAVRQKGIKV